MYSNRTGFPSGVQHNRTAESVSSVDITPLHSVGIATREEKGRSAVLRESTGSVMDGVNLKGMYETSQIKETSIRRLCKTGQSGRGLNCSRLLAGKTVLVDASGADRT